MASKKNPEGVITKKVKFQNKELTLYSLDGVTWSSRVDELRTIQDRHNTEQAGFSSDLKGEEKEKSKFSIKPKRPMPQRAAVVVDDEDEIIDDEIDEPDIEDELDDDIPVEDDDEKPTAPKKGAGKVKLPIKSDKKAPIAPKKQPVKKEVVKAKPKPAPKKATPVKKVKVKPAPKKKGKKK